MAVSKYWLILEMVVPRMELKVPSKTMQNYLQMWQVFQSHAMAIKKLNWFQGTFRQSSPSAALFLLNMWRPISISINFTTYVIGGYSVLTFYYKTRATSSFFFSRFIYWFNHFRVRENIGLIWDWIQTGTLTSWLRGSKDEDI